MPYCLTLNLSTATRMIGGLKNLLFIARHLSGLLLLINSVKNCLMQLKRKLNGTIHQANHVSTT